MKERFLNISAFMQFHSRRNAWTSTSASWNQDSKSKPHHLTWEGSSEDNRLPAVTAQSARVYSALRTLSGGNLIHPRMRHVMRRGTASSHSYFHRVHRLSNIQRSMEETNDWYCINSLFQTCKKYVTLIFCNLILISCKRLIIRYLKQHAQSTWNNHLSLMFMSHLHVSTSTRSSTERYIQRHTNTANSNLITVQQDATYSVYYISVGSSTCFECWHPSSGARTAVITASGID